MFGSNFCSLTFKDTNKNTNFGRIDLKIMSNYVIVHINVFRLYRECKYNVYIILGENGSLGFQKAFIITNNCGCLNNTFRITSKNSKFSIENYKNISCVVLSSIDKKSNDITAFCDKIFDYKKIIHIDKKSNFEKKEIYHYNDKFEALIDSNNDYWPFNKKMNSIKLVKININDFNKIKLNIHNNLKKFIENNNKFYGYLIFGSFKKEDKILYILGIPDKYSFNQALAMANMGIYRFVTLDFKRNANQGDLGFWLYFT